MRWMLAIMFFTLLGCSGTGPVTKGPETGQPKEIEVDTTVEVSVSKPLTRTTGFPEICEKAVICCFAASKLVPDMSRGCQKLRDNISKAIAKGPRDREVAVEQCTRAMEAWARNRVAPAVCRDR